MSIKTIVPALLLTALLTSCRTAQPTPTASPQPTAAPTATAQSNVAGETAGGTLALPAQLSDGRRTLTVYVVDAEKTEEMEAEEYLCGVLAGEMRSDWPMEALKAQAVIARTYLIDFLSAKGGSRYGGADISTDEQESQAFDLSGVNDAIRQAVEETRGEVIVCDGQAIKAWFHSCSGGKTAMATEGLNYDQADPPYIAVVDSDESAARSDALAWSASFTKDEIKAALDEMGLEADTLEPVKISERGPSGRAVTLTFGTTAVNAAELRIALGSERFRSTLLTKCEWADGRLEAAGKGFGHGVGMSQWGAYTMAENGSGYKEIIEHYFRDVEIVQAWE